MDRIMSLQSFSNVQYNGINPLPPHLLSGSPALHTVYYTLLFSNNGIFSGRQSFSSFFSLCSVLGKPPAGATSRQETRYLLLYIDYVQ
jgi:hypothetical protein